MNILLTGSRGFIGSHLHERLSGLGHNVIEFDNQIEKPVSSITLKKLEEERIGYVIHLAATADVRRSIKYPNEYWQNNVMESKRLFDICYGEDIPVLYASSSCAKHWYLSPYGTTKKAMEAFAYPGQIGMRFTTVYGPGSRPRMLISRLKEGNIDYMTNHTRDFIHVYDVCKAIIKIMEKGDKPIYDVCTGEGWNIKELCHMAGWEGLEESVGDKCEVLDNVSNPRHLKELGWTPEESLLDYLEIQPN